MIDVQQNFEKKTLNINEILNDLKEKNLIIDKKILEYQFEIRELYKIIEGIEKVQSNRGAAHFIKENWWRIGTFILTMSAIMAAIGDYLYRLPPPR